MTSSEPNVDKLTSAQTTAYELTRRYRSVAGSLRFWDMREAAIGRATEVAFSTFERLRAEAEMLSDEADRYSQAAEAEPANGQDEFDESNELLPAESSFALYEETDDAWSDAAEKVRDQENQLTLLRHEATLIEAGHLFEAAEALHAARTSTEEIRSLIAAELMSAADYSQDIGGVTIFDPEYRGPVLLRAAAATLRDPDDVAARKQWRSYAMLGVPEHKRRAKEMADALARLDQLNVPAKAGESAEEASKTYRTAGDRLDKALKAATAHADTVRLRDRIPVASRGWTDVQRLCNRLLFTVTSRLLDVAEALDATSGQDVERELRAADWKSVLDSLEFMSAVARDRATEAEKRLRAAETAAERRSSLAALFARVAESEAVEARVKQRELQWKKSLIEGDNYREESATLISHTRAMEQNTLDMAMAVLEDESSSVLNQLIAVAGINSAAFDMTGSWAEVASLQAAAAHAYLDGIAVYETAEYASSENSKSAVQEADAAAGEALTQAKIASGLRTELREAQRQVDAAEEILGHWARADATDEERSRLPKWQTGLSELRTRMSEIEEDIVSADLLVMERLTDTINLAKELRHEALKQRFNDERSSQALEAAGDAVAARTELAVHGHEFSAEGHSEADLAATRARRYAEFARANEMALATRAAQADRQLTVARTIHAAGAVQLVEAVRFVELVAKEAKERAAEESEFNVLRVSAENARVRLAELISAETLDGSA